MQPSYTTKTLNKNEHLWLGNLTWNILCLLVCLLYSLLILHLSDPYPRKDDLNDIFGFLNQYIYSHTLSTKIASFFYPNSDHITLLNHVIFFIQFNILGEINFQQLILVGCFFTIGTAFITQRQLQASPTIAFFIFSSYLSLCFWDSSLWAMTSISHQATLFFAALCFSQATSNKWAGAILFAIASHSSQTNGILCWPILAAISLLNDKKNIIRLLIIASIASMWSVALNYTFETFTPKNQIYNLTEEMHIENTEATFTQWIKNIFILIGQVWLPFTKASHALSTGIIISCIVVFYLTNVRHQLKRHLPALAFLTFNAGTLAGIAYSRMAHFISFNPSLYDKYRIYSILILIITISALAARHHKSWSKYLLSLLGCILFASNLFYVRDAQRDSTLTKNSIIYWQVDGNLSRAESLHFPGSDHFYFLANHLKLWNAYTALGYPVIEFRESDENCPHVENLRYCNFNILHYKRATTAQIIPNHNLPIASKIQLCGNNDISLISPPITELHTAANRLWIDRTSLPNHLTHFILKSEHGLLCQGPLGWALNKPRIWEHRSPIPYDYKQ